jgi:hypothetical protein
MFNRSVKDTRRELIQINFLMRETVSTLHISYQPRQDKSLISMSKITKRYQII